MAKEADKTMTLGPFKGGLNLQSDPTDVLDTQVVEALNFDSDPNGALKSRPPFVTAGPSLQLGATGGAKLLGFFYATDGSVYLIASDGLSSTWRFSGGAWTLITDTFAATAMVQFDGKAWLVAPFFESDPGGYWTPAGGFVSDANMPKGTDIAVYKDRMWVVSGQGSTSPTSMFYSKLIVEGTIWASAASREVQVSPGDGQAIVALRSYYNALLVFRTQSIYSYAYATSTAAATVGIVAPGIGLASRECLVAYESYLYFMYDDKAYEFVGSRAQRVNQQVPFRAGNTANISMPFAVSTFGKRILFAYYDYIYVFNTDTRTWTRWNSEAWGSVAQVLEPIPGTSLIDAFASPSKTVAPSTIYRNLVRNPWPTNSGNTDDWQSRFGFTSTFNGSECVWACPSTQDSNSRGWDIRGNLDTPPGTSGLAVSIPVTVGQQVRIELNVKSTKGLTFNIQSRIHDGAGNWLGPQNSSAPTTLVPNVYSKLVFSFAAAFTGFIVFSVRAQTGVTLTSADTISGKQVLIETGPTIRGAYFDGGTFAPGTHPDVYTNYEGAANASESRLTVYRKAPLLKINEALNASDVEAFDCVMQTKNYSFDVPSAYKRMWWWGVDAVFRGTIKGVAHPIVQTQTTDWGTLWSSGLTWADLLSSTWAAPVGSDSIIDVTTEYDTQGLGFLRKFVKLKKAMRFRQVYFRVEFSTDGSINKSPVYLFTLRAKIVVRQFVAKAIS